LEPWFPRPLAAKHDATEKKYKDKKEENSRRQVARRGYVAGYRSAIRGR
jgi:hypothetical protein